MKIVKQKKLVVELTQEIKKAKVTAKMIMKERLSCGNKNEILSVHKYAKIKALYNFLYNHRGITDMQLQEILSQRRFKFKYLRELIEKYQKFLPNLKCEGPSFYIKRETEYEQFQKRFEGKLV